MWFLPVYINYSRHSIPSTLNFLIALGVSVDVDVDVNTAIEFIPQFSCPGTCLPQAILLGTFANKMKFLQLASIVTGLTALTWLVTALPTANPPDANGLTTLENRQCPVTISCSPAGSATFCDEPCVKCGFEGGWVSSIPFLFFASYTLVWSSLV